ncbi:MAG: hypothetical protein FJZ47_04570 [Candidatus Tectomicrobia bacterium]|uniref:Cell division protein ZapB n=1 Tax=Tectimicrobiota bacterium TaxID=2528274 RepID=A0A938B2R4_UNCTE|nr:hypothetical protein [Candidatus Tectomicrobia bacterium]
MDTTRLDRLEQQIGQLLQAFQQLKEENRRLTQCMAQAQQSMDDQQEQLAARQAEQQELHHLRTMNEQLQRERLFMRDRLEEMLVAIERLEGCACISSAS